jgi:excinuclease UvrABC ATPase subunit/very-short-patch-repair endonuclease
MTYNIISTQHESIDDLDPRQYIIIKGAKVNNLKGVDVAIKRNSLTVITGLSGSGKSSLAFDTLYAEGQRMYVESLSSYARQFLGRMEKPEVEYIKGISPAIAIEQKVTTKNPRSTVGTTTEIYDYFKLFFARIGRTLSPVSGNEVKKDSVTDVINYLFSFEEGTRFMIMAPFKIGENRGLNQELDLLLKKGYARLVAKGEVLQIEDITSGEASIEDFKLSDLFILIDRAVIQFDENSNPDEDTQYRLSDSVQTALFEGEGECVVLNPNPTPAIPRREGVISSPPYGGGVKGVSNGVSFSDRFELDGIVFEEPSVNLFTFNNPYGACRRCEGFGNVLGLDPELVIPDKTLSVFEGAIAPWRSEKMSEWLVPLIRNGIKFDFPIHREYKSLTEDEKLLLWRGNEYFDGLDKFFSFVEAKAHKVQYRVMLSRYRGRTICPECRGSRLRGDASYVKIHGKSIIDLVLMSLKEVSQWFQELELTEAENAIAKRILIEIQNRLDYMERVGLGYLTLNRLASTLSGGESQRIRLATSLGSALVGSMYILDEPSIGLHPRDTQRLISVLESLRDIGNTVIVVEHEEEVMRAADDIIDIGPDAGKLGGDLIFQGRLEVLPPPPNPQRWGGDSEKTGVSDEISQQSINQEVQPYYHSTFQEWVAVKGYAKENRKKMTDAEKKVWEKVRKEQLGCKFRRQHTIGFFIADFVCLSKNLVVEIDGEQHKELVEYDKKRTDFLNAQGFDVIRFTSEEVFTDLGSVLKALANKLENVEPFNKRTPHLTPPQRWGGELAPSPSLGRARVGSHTLRFLSGKDTIEVPRHRRKATDFIEVIGAKENNLKDISVKFPLGTLTVVTGVSGSGKSTLVRGILYPALMRGKGSYSQDSGKFKELKGNLARITQIEMVDQNPIGKSSRSNPVTYIKAYDAIRALMSDQHLSKVRDYKPAFFSFNVDGGRCEACQGEGQQTIEMQFMADVKLTCESCKGRRFKQEILEVTFNEKNISDILNMTIDEAIEFFEKGESRIAKRLRPLQDVGLGYIGLGQSSNTLSGGEAQRVKLAYFLSKGNADTGKTLFIFDEPTTGLHFHDIRKLLKALNALVEQGDSVIVIEHNMEVIKSADWVIDLGPDGGDGGGYVCFEGTPEEMVKIEGNYTADFLKGKI